MADYFTATDLELAADRQYLIQIADDDGDGIADSKVTAWAITAACSFMDGWLALNPGIPITTVAPVLKMLGIKIALYLLASRPPRIVASDVRTDFEMCVARLQEIVQGTYNINPDDTTEGDPTSVIKVNKDETTSVWYAREFPRSGY